MELRKLVADLAIDQRSTPDLAAQVLREAIMRGLFADGQALRQDELAAQLGMSKIPVREALRRLEAEGLVIFYPNRGAVVATLSAGEAQEIAEMRVALETLALRLAVPLLRDQDLARARLLLAELDKELQIAHWSTLNWEFHSALYRPAERPQLLTTIRSLHTSLDRYMQMVLADMQHQTRSQKEHYALLAACESGDACAALNILSEHIQTSGTLLSSHLKHKAALGAEAKRSGAERRRTRG